MEKKEFAAIVLDLEHEIFIVYIALLISFIDVYPFCRPQIANLIIKKALIQIFVKYADFVNIFSLNLTFKLLEYIGINNHAIKLVNANRFIRLFKSPIDAPDIVHLQKNLNNLTIKNWFAF